MCACGPIAMATTSSSPAAVNLAEQTCGNYISKPTHACWPTTTAGGCGGASLLYLLNQLDAFCADEIYFVLFIWIGKVRMFCIFQIRGRLYKSVYIFLCRIQKFKLFFFVKFIIFYLESKVTLNLFWLCLFFVFFMQGVIFFNLTKLVDEFVLFCKTKVFVR